MSDKSNPKGLKDFKVERGYTKWLHIPYMPVEDEVGELVIKASGAWSTNWNFREGLRFLTPYGKAGVLRRS